MRPILALLPFTLFLGVGCSTTSSTNGDPLYDHQVTAYTAVFSSASVYANVTVTPFFSPDWSLPLQVNLINSAQEYLDIANPEFSSWSGCTYGNATGWMGCNVTFQRNGETFPIFQAILNAIHRGVGVRLLTNLYNNELTIPGLITPLEFLAVAGAQVSCIPHSGPLLPDNNLHALQVAAG
jgi:phosphatidylserine/phosphatidylglycerophosphate/cardiolipin synthase-like enzyme